MNHIVSSNIKYYNQVNDAVDKKLKLGINPSLSNSSVKDPTK